MPYLIYHWLSCPKFTVRVVTGSDSVIVFSAPIVRKFVETHISSLLSWSSKFGPVTHCRYLKVVKP